MTNERHAEDDRSGLATVSPWLMALAMVVILFLLGWTWLNLQSVESPRGSFDIWAEMDRVISGQEVDPSQLGRARDVIPIPDGYELVGTTGDEQAGQIVTGLAASGSVELIAAEFGAALEGVGWTPSEVGIGGFGLVGYTRSGVPGAALVSYQQVATDSVSIVVTLY